MTLLELLFGDPDDRIDDGRRRAVEAVIRSEMDEHPVERGECVGRREEPSSKESFARGRRALWEELKR